VNQASLVQLFGRLTQLGYCRAQVLKSYILVLRGFCQHSESFLAVFASKRYGVVRQRLCFVKRNPPHGSNRLC